MNDSREEIIRLNIERFARLVGAESDPCRRRTLDLLLIEARAELEFLIDSREIAAGLRGKRKVDGDGVDQLLEKARKCRVAALACDHQSRSDVFLRIAAGYESMAEDFRRSLALRDRDNARHLRPD